MTSMSVSISEVGLLTPLKFMCFTLKKKKHLKAKLCLGGRFTVIVIIGFIIVFVISLFC